MNSMKTEKSVEDQGECKITVNGAKDWYYDI